MHYTKKNVEISFLTNLKSYRFSIWNHTTNFVYHRAVDDECSPPNIYLKAFFLLVEDFFCTVLVIFMHIIKIQDPFDDSVRIDIRFSHGYDGRLQVVMRPPL